MNGPYKGVAVILQCRLGSKRLPGKALLSLGGIPMVRYVMSVVKNIDAQYYILACDEASYETLAPLAAFEGYTCIQGDEQDVLSRFCHVIKTINSKKENIPIEVVVRVTADNPFIFASCANASVRRYFELSEPDYFTFTGLPVGSGVELINATSLLRAQSLTDDPYDKEHVAPSLYRHQDKFRCIREIAPISWYHPDIRVTVDEEVDYKRAVHIVKYLNSKGLSTSFRAEDIVKAYEYATKLILFYPSIRVGEGTGHLRRVVKIIKDIVRDIRCAIYIKKDEGIKEVASHILEELPEGIMVEEIPKDVFLIVLDNFRTSKDEMLFLKKQAPVVAIDEGGAGRAYADFLLDILPSLKMEKTEESLKYFANIEDVSFIALPLHRRKELRAKQQKIVMRNAKLLVVCGGENAANMALPVANILSEMGFQVSLVAPNLSFDDIEKCSEKIKTYAKIDNLREKLYEWDIIVTHYGFTAFEALVAGCLVLLISPTQYHYNLSVMAGFSAIENPHPTIEDFRKAFSNGLKVPNMVGVNSEARNLSDFIKELFTSKKCNCPVCGEDASNNIVVRVPDKTIAYCPECNLHHLSFIISKQSDYSKSYFFDEYKAQYGKTYLEDFEYIKKLGIARMKHINSIFDETFQKKQELNIFTTEKKLLDIGCAYGPFLEAAKMSLWQPIGTDICAEAVEYVNETLHIPAFVSSFPSMPLSFEYIYKKQVTGSGYEKITLPMEEGSFLAVTMWYVIEHFSDLGTVLEKVASLLAPGGIFAFSTPTISGITGKQSIYDFAYKSPIDHYSLMDASRIEKLLEKYHFKLCKIVSVGHHPERFNLPFKIKKNGVLWHVVDKISRRYNLGDGMEVYAIRRGTI